MHAKRRALICCVRLVLRLALFSRSENRADPILYIITLKTQRTMSGVGRGRGAVVPAWMKAQGVTMPAPGGGIRPRLYK